MKIAITGATGFVGRKLVLALQQRGHHIVALVRDVVAARSLLGADCTLARIDDDDALASAVDGADAVVNLAGTSIAQRWTRAARKRIVASRVALTRRVVDAITVASARPSVLVSVSAVGVYGDAGDTVVGDDAPAGSGFLAELGQRWEAEARRAEALGVRVALPRLGVVLGDGGMVATLLAAFRCGVGAVLGAGTQFMSVIAVDDVLRIVVLALEDSRIKGTFNAVAPTPTTQAEFSHALARHCGWRRAWLRVPGPVVKLLGGGASALVLDSQRVIPQRLQQWGFAWEHPDVHACLRQLRPASAVTIDRPTALPPVGYLANQAPQYRLKTRTVVQADPQTVFDFFSKPENLGAMTPSHMRFQITEGGGVDVEAGSRFRYRIRLRGVAIPWTTRIDAFDPTDRFIDVQLSGPYRYWHHRHDFEALPDGRTVVHDTVHFMPRLGLLGHLAQWLFVARDLNAIFEFRARAMTLRFGRGDAPSASAEHPVTEQQRSVA